MKGTSRLSETPLAESLQTSIVKRNGVFFGDEYERSHAMCEDSKKTILIRIIVEMNFIPPAYQTYLPVST
jgi:hypothetical protein